MIKYRITNSYKHKHLNFEQLYKNCTNTHVYKLKLGLMKKISDK